MAKLTKEEWAAARVKWESDPREGFDWLVAELLLDVSRQAVSKTAKAQGWAKEGATKKVAEKRVAQLTKATKYLPEYAEKNYRLSLLGFDYLAIRNQPVVYAIGERSTGKWVYVGQTKNPKKRFDAYKYPSLCHNSGLSNWLLNNKGNIFVEILHFGINGLDDAEKMWIKIGGDSMFNIASGGECAWKNRHKKPWMAGAGILCPSSLVIQRKKSIVEKNEIRTLIKSMSDANRSFFEVSLAKDIIELLPLGPMNKRINLWLDRCSERLDESFSQLI